MSLINKEILPFTAQAYDPKMMSLKKFHKKILKVHGASYASILLTSLSYVPTELEDLQNQYEKLQELGVNVFSVSTDTHFVHKAWHDHSDAISKIQYKMIGDPSQTITVTSMY